MLLEAGFRLAGQSVADALGRAGKTRKLPAMTLWTMALN